MARRSTTTTTSTPSTACGRSRLPAGSRRAGCTRRRCDSSRSPPTVAGWRPVATSSRAICGRSRWIRRPARRPARPSRSLSKTSSGTSSRSARRTASDSTFIVTRAGNLRELWMVPTAGGRAEMLAAGGVGGWSAWSADSRQVFFVNDDRAPAHRRRHPARRDRVPHRCRVADAGGGAGRRLVAFTSHRCRRHQQRVDARRRRPSVARSPARPTDTSYPTWSPDGRWLAVELDRRRRHSRRLRERRRRHARPTDRGPPRSASPADGLPTATRSSIPAVP